MRNSNISLNRRKVAPGHALRRPFHLLAAIVIALCFTQSAQAIDPDRTMSQYVRQQWGIESGFPRGPVYAINQTADGYLWIGTEAGLVRFDGRNFSLIQSPIPQLPTIKNILGLETDDRGDLWARLPRPMLLHYRDGVFEDARRDPRLFGSVVTAISRSRDGALLFWGEQGCIVMRGGKTQIVPAPAGFTRSTVLAMNGSSGSRGRSPHHR